MSVEDEIELVVARRHSDPHRVLGAHPVDDGVVVRAFRPDAVGVVARVHDGEPVILAQRHPSGLFEGLVRDARLPLRYEFEVSYPGGNVYTLRDPYAFAPTLGDLDLHLIGEGHHEELYDRLGAHPREIDGVLGTAFALWAPAAQAVSVVGDFNSWDGRLNAMRVLGSSGIWEIFLPGVAEGAAYKFEILSSGGERRMKADPVAFRTVLMPGTDSIVHRSHHLWRDVEWMERRQMAQPHAGPLAIYEVHLGSWRLNPVEGNRSLHYRELADELAEYVTDLGFTHVELMPVMEHPFSGSWGYQVTSYFAPTARFGSPDEFKQFVDHLHGAGVGVILDWVPAHFPRDDWALARFDGSALYEHEHLRGAHPDWGTLIFNYGRHEVRNFLDASAFFWTHEYHADGIRVDGVASMLYLDYSRAEGEWTPNVQGGREDLEAIGFIQELNEILHRREPGVISVAEESTAWAGVSRPTVAGGLGFGFKWNMGWMHDTLGYFQHDPVYRSYHHHELTFGLLYAFTENFILPLSHDEVVHGKRSLYGQMAGDRWQKLANLRALYGYMWAHPGKKLLFMGGEFAQEQEWSYQRSLDWHLLERPEHAGVQRLVRDLNHLLRNEPALYEQDFDPAGFWWLESNDAASNVFAFARASRAGQRLLVCAANLSPVPRERYRLGLPRPGHWVELLNTDSAHYGGSNAGNAGGVEAAPTPWHGQDSSAEVTLPPWRSSGSFQAPPTADPPTSFAHPGAPPAGLEQKPSGQGLGRPVSCACPPGRGRWSRAGSVEIRDDQHRADVSIQLLRRLLHRSSGFSGGGPP
jgi:1,4-alpha-glucan branching enzyme